MPATAGLKAGVSPENRTFSQQGHETWARDEGSTLGAKAMLAQCTEPLERHTKA